MQTSNLPPYRDSLETSCIRIIRSVTTGHSCVENRKKNPPQKTYNYKIYMRTKLASVSSSRNFEFKLSLNLFYRIKITYIISMHEIYKRKFIRSI